MKNAIKINIQNLFTLWETVGKAFNTFSDYDLFSYCQVPGSEWPNRIWFKSECTKEALQKVINVVRQSPVPLSVSHWSNFDNRLYAEFQEMGFAIKSHQIGMSLKPTQKLILRNRTDLLRVTSKEQAAIWDILYPQSFGYRISKNTVLETKDSIRYFIIQFNGKAIGTVIVFTTGKVMGIHGVGIIPEYRKNGFAEEAMAQIINQALDENMESIVLQASAMGKGVYSKLGFSEDFLLMNYQLTKENK